MNSNFPVLNRANYSSPQTNCKITKSSQDDLKVGSVVEGRKIRDPETSSSVNHVVAGSLIAKGKEIDGIKWATILKSPATSSISSASNSLACFSPILEEREDLAEPSVEVIEDGEARWKNAVVVQVLGKIPNLNYFCKMVDIL